MRLEGVGECSVVGWDGMGWGEVGEWGWGKVRWDGMGKEREQESVLT